MACIVYKSIAIKAAVSSDASVQSTYGSGTGPVHYSNVACTGRESRLSGCRRHRLTGSCSGDKAGVHCHFDYLCMFAYTP